MRFNGHSNLEGRHAFLSPSKYHWVNYSDDKLFRMYQMHRATIVGTRLHALAAELIRMKQPLPRTGLTLNMYVNDALGFMLEPEVALYYSDNAFGHVDAIGFRKNTLRVHDLKTGETRTSFHQLEVYVALFCLEYGIKPSDIKIELRIYQNNEVAVYVPELHDIVRIMDRIVTFDRYINEMREQELS